MKTKPRAIGTAAETATRRLLSLYWPTADRSPLRGNRDQGDIQGTGIFIWEVKAGHAAREVNDGLLTEWMRQTEVERVNAKATYGVLVTTRLGYGPARASRWWAWLPVDQFATLVGGCYLPDAEMPIRLELGALLELLADQGFTADAPAEEPAADESDLELVGGV